MIRPPDTPPLARHAIWVVGCRVVGIAATLASNILAARLLGPAEFGIYLLLTTVIALGSVLGMSGLNEAALRLISESLGRGEASLARAFLKRTLTIVVVTSLLAALLATIGMPLVQIATGHAPLPASLMVVIAVGVTALVWQQIAAESLRALGDLRLASLFSGGQTGGPLSNLLLLAGLLALAIVCARPDATLVLMLSVVSICLTVPLAYIGLWRVSGASEPTSGDASLCLTPEQERQLLVVGGTLLINQLLAFGSQQLDIWLGGAILAPEALGLYGAAKRSLLLAAMPVQMAMLTVISTVPRLYAQGRMRELERVVRRAAGLAAVPSLVALALLAFFSDPIFRLIFGESYVGATPTVLVMIAGHLVLVLSGNPPYVLTMTGRHRTVLTVNLIAAAILILAGAVGAKWYGAVGLAAGSAASLAVQNGLLWWLARRQLGIWTHVGLPSLTTAPTVPPEIITAIPTAQKT